MSNNNLCEETISRTDEGQPRPKYIFNKCGTNLYFFTLQRFGPSPSLNFKGMLTSSYFCLWQNSVITIVLNPLKSCNRFGEMEKVQVVLDGHSGRSRGFAFIYYASVDDAAEVGEQI